MTAPSWFANAACRGMGHDAWFPVEDSRRASSAEGKAICATCPVSAECLQYAQDRHIMDGIWGGVMPASVRRKELKDKARDKRLNAVRMNLNPRFAKPVGTHGIRASYSAGCRCLDCTNANRLYERSRKRSQKASA